MLVDTVRHHYRRQFVPFLFAVAILLMAWGVAGAIDMCGGCWVRELVATESANCLTPEGACKNGTYAVPEYYRCASSGTGVPGRVNCSFARQQIGTFYDCDDSTNWLAYAACVVGIGSCGVSCAACIADPTKLTCIGCAVACADAAIACPMASYSSCTAKDPQTVFRHVFSSLSGDNCNGQ